MGTGPDRDDGAGISIEDPLAFERHLGDLSARFADLPPAAPAAAKYYRRTGLESNLGIPLRIGGRGMDVIAFA